MIRRDARINLLISTGHFLSHFYQLCLPPLFLVWQRQFDISFAELGLTVVLMTGTAAVLQTPGRIPGRPLRRAPVSDRRRAGDVARDRADGLRDCVLADPRFVVDFGYRQRRVPPVRLRDPCRLDPQGAHGPLLRPARLQRQYRFCARPADDRGAAERHGLARRPAGGRRSRPAGGRGRHRPESHPARPGAQGCARARHVDARAAARPDAGPVLPVLFSRRHGERRRNGLADHRAARGERARPCARLGRAHRLYGGERRRRPSRRMGGRQVATVTSRSLSPG